MKKFILILSMTFIQFVLFDNPLAANDLRKNANGTYPQTPEEVVKAYCRSDFDGLGLGPRTWKNFQQYTTWEDAPGWDQFFIASKFTITKIKETDTAADIKVVYELIGELLPSAYYGYTLTTNKIGEVYIFNLVKIGNFWRIKRPQEPPHISPEIAVKILQKRMANEKDPLTQKNIKMIVDYLKKP